LEGLTVRENVLLAAALADRPVAEAERRTDELLEALGIGALADRRTSGLSGGEEHRVAVARALVHAPAVVLADEPTGNLDRASGLAVAGALADLARDRRVAVLVATHDQRLRPFATRRLWIEDGHLGEAT
jgi:ABC-type lipoprotein export system ATPase subunit